MKSMLHEASSVLKAIQKAWDEAGKPVEFTIKVLEAGEKNFIGFCKTPAVISIAYEPRKQFDKNKKDFDSKNKLIKKIEPVQNFQNKQQQPLRPGQIQQKAMPQPLRAQGIQVRQIAPKQSIPLKQALPQQQEAEPMTWSNEWMEDITGWLNELLAILGSPTKFEMQVTGKQLLILFNSSVLESVADEKMIFISFSYLLMQFLKKKYKKKLSKYQIVLNSKVTTPNDSVKQEPDKF